MVLVTFVQGATYFYIYSKYIDQYSRILLDDYIRTGEAEHIILHDRFERYDEEWQILELQVRSYTSPWIALLDMLNMIVKR